MAYQLYPDGSVKNIIIKNISKSPISPVESVTIENQKKSADVIKNSAIEILGEFRSGRNYAENDHNLFSSNLGDISLILQNEKIESLDNFNWKKPDTYASLGEFLNKSESEIFELEKKRLDKLNEKSLSGVIGKTEQLYPDAYGFQMNFDNPTRESINFYKNYNTFFDLDFNYSGRSDNEKNLEIFADEAELLYGVPLLLNEPDRFIDDLGNVFESMLDMLLAAIIPITTISVIQSLLQASQNGPPDPFSLFGFIKSGKADSYGKFITYVKFDPDNNPFLAIAFNSVIEALASVLKVIERLMNFPSERLNNGLTIIVTAKKLLKDIASFCVGYIYYLIPGFKLDSNILQGDITRIITSLLSIVASAVTINQSKHNYNLLIRKIVMNNYYRKEIQFKAKTITNKDGSQYNYDDQQWYKLSDFFHRFIGQRVAVGQQVINIFYTSARNKYNKPFAIQKMSELPISYIDDDNSSTFPISIGSSITGEDDGSDNKSITELNFDKSIYSLTSLIQNSSNSANDYIKYHNELINQNLKIYQKEEKRLDKDHVKKLEKIIDSDYMPFSIQDLRTNELFKFHAFLNSYSDTFSPGWDDMPIGFGRMDPIKIYKGTSRNISVDFWLISMSNEDFDYMWWMINRLIALVYPQWSAARPANIENQLKAGLFNKKSKKYNGLSFGQPFTQIPVGSPVIRLRLGDLFTSNYSKKDLARIFGLNFKNNPEQTFKVNLQEFKNICNQFNQINDEAFGNSKMELLGYQYFPKEFLNNASNFDLFGLFSPYQEDFEKFENNSRIDFECTSSGSIDNYKLKTAISQKISGKAEFYHNRGDKVDLDDINNPKVNGNDKNDELAFPNLAIKPSFKKLIFYPVSIKKDKEFQCLMLLYELTFPVDVSTPNSTLKQSQLNDAIGKLGEIIQNYLLKRDVTQSNLNVKAFMSSHGQYEVDSEGSLSSSVQEGTQELINNPVVKAYESTLGEGLAGTIQTFNISYENEIPWEIEKGSRAPIAVKISLGMSVIHDILPGLDDKGMMRAPTYRVGNINRGFFGDSVYQEINENLSYINNKLMKE